MSVRDFTINVDEIKQNSFYINTIKKMPKGALLHCHVSAIVNVYDYLQYLKINAPEIYNKMYFLTDNSKIIELKNFILDNYQAFYDEINKNDVVKNILNLPAPPIPQQSSPDNWEYMNKLFGRLILHTDNNSLTYFKDEPYVEGYTAVNTMTDDQIKNICNGYKMKDITEYNWSKLRGSTGPYWTIYRDRDYYLHYFRFFLNNCIAENLQHVEIKMSLGGFYDTKLSDVTVGGKKIKFYYRKPYEDGNEQDLDTLSKILDNIKNLQSEKEYKDKITFTLIGSIAKARKSEYCKIKPCPKTQCSKTYMNCENKALSNICTVEQIDAIDLQGEEDETIPTSLYLGTLIKDCSTKNLVIHSGETITDDTVYNNNLMSMVYLRNSNLDANRYEPDPIKDASGNPIKDASGNEVINYDKKFFTKKFIVLDME